MEASRVSKERRSRRSRLLTYLEYSIDANLHNLKSRSMSLTPSWSFRNFLPESVSDWYEPSDDHHLFTDRFYMQQSAMSTHSRPIIPEKPMSATSAVCGSIEREIPDSLLLEALEGFETGQQDITEKKKEPKKRRFGEPVTDKEIEERKATAVPKKTQHDTMYCVRVFDEWRESRYKETRVAIAPLIQLSIEELNRYLSAFVLEARKQDGSFYLSDSLMHIVAGLMRYLRWNGQPDIDLFKQPSFSEFRRCLDAEMKRLKASGESCRKKKAEPIAEDEEEKLWEMKLLGDHTPQVLLDTIVYCNGLYFALRSGEEHRSLRANPCQIQVFEKPGQTPYLQYTEDISKNRPGGLKGRKISTKTVVHHANEENPSRCFVRLFKLYQSLCPPDRPDHAFYLKPLTRPTSKLWFSKQPVGHNTLKNTVARLCKAAGIDGFKTNHSLRATTATRLFHHAVDEQLIMQRTGHRSIDGIRSYKRPCMEQQQRISELLNSENHKTTSSLQSLSLLLNHHLQIVSQSPVKESSRSSN